MDSGEWRKRVQESFADSMDNKYNTLQRGETTISNQICMYMYEYIHTCSKRY